MQNAKFEERDAQVLGISTDARPTQTAFAASVGSVPYPVLADFHPKAAVTQSYGVYNEQRGTPDRAVFIIDKSGQVRWKQVYASAGDIDYDAILRGSKL
jgi:alkyl hydroperoxide reductase subunit AhpC